MRKGLRLAAEAFFISARHLESLPTAENNSTIGLGKGQGVLVLGPFSAGDSLRIYRLQRQGISLDLQWTLTQPHMPLWEAWLAFLTQQAMGQPTYVLYDPYDGEAFIQVRYRPHQAAADVVYVAPALAHGRRTVNAWMRLLESACSDAAGRGIQRVFANLPESGPEIDVFQQAGFTLYAGEEVYRLAQPQLYQQKEELPAIRPQQPEDWPAVQRLCVAITPQRVRQAEGSIAPTTGGNRNCRRYVLPSEDGDDLQAAIIIYSGGLAHWLRVLVHPDRHPMAGTLVRWGLAMTAGGPPKPVYCNVRQYESGMRAALVAAGFELYTTRSLMVKHTVAWVKVAPQELVPVLKSGAEPVPPAFRINGEAELQPSNGRLATEHI